MKAGITQRVTSMVMPAPIVINAPIVWRSGMGWLLRGALGAGGEWRKTGLQQFIKRDACDICDCRNPACRDASLALPRLNSGGRKSELTSEWAGAPMLLDDDECFGHVRYVRRIHTKSNDYFAQTCAVFSHIVTG